MAESTLSLFFEDLGKSTAHYLGWGRKATVGDGLTTAQVANVNAANNAGYRRFLLSHEWAFRSPRVAFTLWADVAGTLTGVFASPNTTLTATTAKFFPSMIGHSIVIATVGTFTITAYTSSTIVTVSGNATCSSKAFTIAADGVYRMADDFGSMKSTEIYYASGSNDNRFITVTSEAMVANALQENAQTNRPYWAGIRPVAIAATGQRFDLAVYPIPDVSYSVTFRYDVNPDALTAGLYPYGGMDHAETIRACCLGAAEEMFNDFQTDKRASADRLLAMSIASDNRNNRPDRIGITRSRGARRGKFAEAWPNEYVTVGTVNGTNFN